MKTKAKQNLTGNTWWRATDIRTRTREDWSNTYTKTQAQRTLGEVETAEKLDTGSNDDQGAFQKPFLSLFPNIIKVKKRWGRRTDKRRAVLWEKGKLKQDLLMSAPCRAGFWCYKAAGATHCGTKSTLWLKVVNRNIFAAGLYCICMCRNFTFWRRIFKQVM